MTASVARWVVVLIPASIAGALVYAAGGGPGLAYPAFMLTMVAAVNVVERVCRR